MKVKGSLSEVFKGIDMKSQLLNQLVGKPLTDNGKQVGVITSYDIETDTIYIEVEDSYGAELFKEHYGYMFEIC
jgi:hypothetical protein